MLQNMSCSSRTWAPAFVLTRLLWAAENYILLSLTVRDVVAKVRLWPWYVARSLKTFIKVLEMIHVSKRKTVKEVTLDLSPTMMRMAIPVSSCWQGLNMYLSSILVNGLNPKEYVRKSYNFFPEMNKSVSWDEKKHSLRWNNLSQGMFYKEVSSFFS